MKNKVVALLAFAATTSFAATKQAQIEQPKDTFNHWGVKGTIFSTNDQLLKNFNEIQVAYKIQVSYHVNKNFYVKSALSWQRHNKIGGAAVVGAEQTTGLFRPYAELGYGVSYNSNLVRSDSVTYDAGTNIAINDQIMPYVEFDNFIYKGHQAFTVGVNYAARKNLTVGGDFQYEPQSKGNNASVFVGYSF